MSFSVAPKFNLKTVCFALTLGFMVLAAAPSVRASETSSSKSARGKFGVVKGSVLDQSGNPIANAYVAFFKVGTSQLLKQVKSSADGSFIARVVPGTYTVLAIAQGFNPISYGSVEIGRASQLNYKFNLERAGSGRTLPEKKIDRSSSKWRVRAARIQSSIYQNSEGEKPVDDTQLSTTADETAEQEPDTDAERGIRSGATVIETFTSNGGGKTSAGANFATLVPLTEKSQIVIAGQANSNLNSPQSVETNFSTRVNGDHFVRINGSFARFGGIEIGGRDRDLGQVSVQAIDEWRVRENLVLVFGFDYSKFVGGGGDSSISPRLGLQFDVDPRTRFRTAYTTQNEERSWSQAVDLEGTTVLMRDPMSVPDLVVDDGKLLMNRSSRFEFGVERLLDSRSSIEANLFFDVTNGRGVGLINMPIGFLGGEADRFVANQTGRAQGVRVVYARRFNGLFSASAGYAFGNGQRLSERGVTNPSNLFEEDNFQSMFGQFVADLRSGTQVRTIFRLSPQATVFSIDPFQGRMTIYDPGLSVVVTQSLPNWGLPIRAEAIIDARNLFDFQNGVATEEGTLKLASQRRLLRGGIMVRF